MISRACVAQEQSGAVSPAQTAVRVRPTRSTLKALIVRPVAAAVIRPLIVDHHYLHSMPAATWRCFGVYAGTELAGAVVFTPGSRHGYRVLAGARPQEVATLARLWLRDDLPKNAESRVIGIVLRELRRHGAWKLVLSYADPAAGHVGTIYQASGWIYLGQGAPGSYVDIGDGTPRHPRTVYGVLGANGVGHLRRTGIPARRCLTAGKYRYAYVIDPAWFWRLRASPQPYPRGGAAP
jgi:hypothetical protein